LHVPPSHRYWISSISSLVIAAGIALLAGCQGIAPGTSSLLAASASTLSFGEVQKSKSSHLSDTVTNTGKSPVTISRANVSGRGFSVTGLSLPMILYPEQSVTFMVTFAPASAGSAGGALAIVSTARNSLLKIALSGTEMEPGQLLISPASLSFSNVQVGGQSSLNGALKATGAPVTISAASINNNEFVLSGLSVPTTLTAGQSTSFAITFNPATTGAASARLMLTSDAEDSLATLELAGQGSTAPHHSVELHWDAAAGSGVVGYNVYRGTVSGGPYSKINSAVAPSTTYTDDNVTAGQTYYYVTTAVSANGNESGYSNQVQAVIPSP
jgi:hypothetical protein